MADDRRRLRRAQLIERVRGAEHRQAATLAHEAEGAWRKLNQLSRRTDALAEIYEVGAGTLDAADLRSASLLGAHLRGLGQTASVQAERARTHADAKLGDLATADRRKTRAQDDRRELCRAISEQRFSAELSLARRNWHEA